MAKRKDTDTTGSNAAPEPRTEIAAVPVASPAPAPAPDKTTATEDLPVVESPSISPAELVRTGDSELEPAGMPIPELAAEATPANSESADATPAAATAGTADTATNILHFKLRPRHKRYALLAASIAVAAALGGVIGALASGGFSAPATVAAHDDSKALQQTLARLTKEVGTLKANLDDANKFAHAQAAKPDAKIESKIETKTAAKADLLKDSAEITGSISAPQTVAAADAVPLPQPRPAQRVAAAESQQPSRMHIVPGWSIRDARGGYIYVESNGDIYQIVPGAPLPGLGPVESIRRLEGRWVVTTPKGVIVSMRDRRYFE